MTVGMRVVEAGCSAALLTAALGVLVAWRMELRRC
jgi:hypothetical protein